MLFVVSLIFKCLSASFWALTSADKDGRPRTFSDPWVAFEALESSLTIYDGAADADEVGYIIQFMISNIPKYGSSRLALEDSHGAALLFTLSKQLFDKLSIYDQHGSYASVISKSPLVPSLLSSSSSSDKSASSKFRNCLC